MSAAAITALVAAAFDGEVPHRIGALIDPKVAGSLLADFKVGPVLPCGETDRRVRVAVSDQGESDRWASVVRENWSHAMAEEWLAMGAGRRRMVDTDGSRLAEIYLDDLQDHPALPYAEAMRPPEDTAPVMCISVKVPSGTTSCVTRHTTPPFQYLIGGLAEAVADLVDQGAEGLWGLRWRRGRPASVVWVTEARWRKNAEMVTAIADGLAVPAAWEACRAAMSRLGCVAYPDAIELYPDGTADLTVGVLVT
jgi:hypothetical protein